MESIPQDCQNVEINKIYINAVLGNFFVLENIIEKIYKKKIELLMPINLCI